MSLLNDYSNFYLLQIRALEQAAQEDHHQGPLPRDPGHDPLHLQRAQQQRLWRRQEGLPVHSQVYTVKSHDQDSCLKEIRYGLVFS